MGEDRCAIRQPQCQVRIGLFVAIPAARRSQHCLLAMNGQCTKTYLVMSNTRLFVADDAILPRRLSLYVCIEFCTIGESDGWRPKRNMLLHVGVTNEAGASQVERFVREVASCDARHVWIK